MINTISPILVTGGAGFVGSHLCRELLSRGYKDIISLDDYSSGSVDNHVEGVTYIRGNTCDIGAIDLPAISTVFHLGEYSRVENSLDNIDLVLEGNIKGTMAVLTLAKSHGAKLIYAGSSTKFSDDGDTINETPYAFSKYVNTELVRNYCNWHSLDYCIAYFYNVFGPGEVEEGTFATVLGIFKRCYLSNQPLPVVSPGTQLRNFTHVYDIVDGLWRLIDAPSGDDYGIGSDEAYSIIKVAEMFKTDYEMVPPRSGNRLTSKLVTEKMKDLGWKCEHKLVDHIVDIVDQHKQAK